MINLTPNWFWDRVQMGGDDECWPWVGNIRDQKKPYGRVYIAGKAYAAHRVALLISKGSPPRYSPCACHTCDNPRCCNPSHLWWGSAKENDEDCVEKGRKAAPSRRKINRAEAVKLRDSGWSYSMLAERYGVHQASIGKVLKAFGRNGPVSPNQHGVRNLKAGEG